MPPAVALAGEMHTEDIEVVDGVFAKGNPTATFAPGSNDGTRARAIGADEHRLLCIAPAPYSSPRSFLPSRCHRGFEEQVIGMFARIKVMALARVLTGALAEPSLVSEPELLET